MTAVVGSPAVGRLYRWAFDCRRWNPTKAEIDLAFSVIQTEEKKRILKFVYKEDAKRALIGRLLIRKCVLDAMREGSERLDAVVAAPSAALTTAMSEIKLVNTSIAAQSPSLNVTQQLQRQQHSLNNDDFVLNRTDRGRPQLSRESGDTQTDRIRRIQDSLDFDFNVSHSGDFAVLAAESRVPSCDTKEDSFSSSATSSPSAPSSSSYSYSASSSSFLIGVDVMKVESPKGKKSSAEFFRLMRRQLTANEWRHVEEAVGEEDQMRRFYRFWCLKESFVKALGVGIGFEVGRLEFEIKDSLYPRDDSRICCCSTTVKVDGNSEMGWLFEETLLDEDHCVAVAIKQDQRRFFHTAPFEILSINRLLKDFDEKSQNEENGNEDNEIEEENSQKDREDD